MAKLTPLKAMRKKCIECCGGSYKEVKLCTDQDCTLHRYRFGKRPTGEELQSYAG